MIDEKYEKAIRGVICNEFEIDNDPDMMRRYVVISEHLFFISKNNNHKMLLTHLDNVYTKMIKRFFQKLPKDMWNISTHCAGLHFRDGMSVPFVVQTYKLATKYLPQSYRTTEDAIEKLSDLLVEEVRNRFQDKDRIYFYQAPHVVDNQGIMMFRAAGIKF